MSRNEETGNNDDVQEVTQQVLPPPPPPPGVGVGNTQNTDQLDVLGQLLERVLNRRSNTSEEDLLRSRISKAQKDFYQ